MGDSGPGFLVQHGQDLGLPVAAVIDDRFVQAFESRAGIHGDVVEIERLQHVDHVVGARMPDEPCVDARLGRHEVRACVGFRRPRDGPRGSGCGLLGAVPPTTRWRRRPRPAAPFGTYGVEELVDVLSTRLATAIPQ
jgi:hypothetical protein